MPDNIPYGELKSYIERLIGHPVRDKRIRAIGVNPLYHTVPRRFLEVGQYYADLEPGIPEQRIVAIFESKLFCVCTPERGAGAGLPYFFTRESVYRVELMK